MTALYAFSKLVDDWGDTNAKTSDVNQAIDWHHWIDACGSVEANPVHRSPLAGITLPDACSSIQLALANTIDRFAIPKKYLHEIVDGVTFDLTHPFSMEDRAQLDRYCYLVASAVGLACLCIWEGDEPEVHPAAIDCGRAFQLTNILRDIKEDRERGRIYVPRDLLVSHDVDIERWRSGKTSGNWQAALLEMVGWARMAYRSGWNVRAALDSDGQRMFSLMWHTYRQLLERVASDLDAAWVRRVRLTRYEKATLYVQHAFTPWYRSWSSRDEIHE